LGKLVYREFKFNGPIFSYKVSNINLPVLECNPNLQADTLELKINSIKSLKLPDGWKPTDGNTYVTYEFPYPHEEHQTGRTQIVSKTDNPGLLLNHFTMKYSFFQNSTRPSN
jgi:hypothetical protein